MALKSAALFIAFALTSTTYAETLECLKNRTPEELKRLSQLKPGVSWQWFLENEPYGSKVPRGVPKPKSKPLSEGIRQAQAGHGPVVYDVDMFMATPAQIADLKAKNKVVICYVAGGSLQFSPEATRDAQGRVIPCSKRKRALARPELEPLLSGLSSEAIKGHIADWPDNCWLDPRHPSVLKALENVAKKAKERGCDGVEFDNMDAGMDDENRKQAGFGASTKEMEKAQLAFNSAVADMLHRNGLCAAIKNGHMFADQQCKKFDLAVVEDIVGQANSRGADSTTKSALDSWKKCATQKPVLAAEYPPPAQYADYQCPSNTGNMSVNYFGIRQYVDGGQTCGVPSTTATVESGDGEAQR